MVDIVLLIIITIVIPVLMAVSWRDGYELGRIDEFERAMKEEEKNDKTVKR